ncbi:DUF4352 domain-containing protein [Nonomuraea sp. NPDC002799]
MSYPQQPPGQQPPRGHGHGPPPPQQAHGYRPAPSSNLSVILLLVIGLPLLLLGGGGAVFLVLTDGASGVSAEHGDLLKAVANGDPPSQTQPSQTQPSQTQPSPTQPSQTQPAKVGETVALQGREPGLKVAVTVNQVVSPATPANTFTKPQAGRRFVAVQITLTNQGAALYSDSPSNGAWLIDGEGQQHRASIAYVTEGESFGGSATINTGDSRKGMLVFEVPEAATAAKLQFALDSGLADQKGEWTLS